MAEFFQYRSRFAVRLFILMRSRRARSVGLISLRLTGRYLSGRGVVCGRFGNGKISAVVIRLPSPGKRSAPVRMLLATATEAA
jgi:hypothetical protein